MSKNKKETGSEPKVKYSDVQCVRCGREHTARFPEKQCHHCDSRDEEERAAWIAFACGASPTVSEILEHNTVAPQMAALYADELLRYFNETFPYPEKKLAI